MKTQIRTIGIGREGCSLLDGVIACGLREELDADGYPAIAAIRYIAVETDIDTLSCSSTDVGFYLGNVSGKSCDPDVLEQMATRTREVLEHVIHGAHLILLLTGLDDPLECAAAAALAELGRARDIMTLSLVSLPSAAAPGRERAAGDLARIMASSDASYVFAADDCAPEDTTCVRPGNTVSKPAGNLIDCANVLAKFLCQPNGRRVGFDFQDLRTALLGWDEPCRAHPEQEIDFRYHYLRWAAQQQTPPAECATTARMSLPLGDAATVLMYVEGGPNFSMSKLRNLVMPIMAEAPKNAFIKYFVEVDPGLSGDALTIDLYVRTDHPRPHRHAKA